MIYLVKGKLGILAMAKTYVINMIVNKFENLTLSLSGKGMSLYDEMMREKTRQIFEKIAK
jgi:hypothetical protein